MSEKPTYEELELRIKELEEETNIRKQAELALKDSEERHRAIVAAFDGLIYVCSQDYRVEFMNDRFIDRTGYNPVGELCYKALHELDSICPWCVNEQVFKGETVRWEIKSPKDDHWYYVVNTPIYHDDGSISKQAMILDITERKQDEEALWQSEKRIDKINECFLGFGTDSNENINHLTALCGELLGATCALYNRLDGDMLCSWGQWNTPIDYNPVDTPDGHICYDVIKSAGDETLVITNLPGTHYAQTDPNVIPYKLKTYLGRAVKLRDAYVGSLCVVYQDDIVSGEADKRVLEIIASAIGVEEERKRAEDALKESEKRYRDIFENVSDFLYFHDLEGHFTEVNLAFIKESGYSDEEMSNLNIIDLLPDDFKHMAKDYFKRVMESGKDEGLMKVVTKDGHELIIEYRNSLVCDSTGPIGIRGSARDITENKRAEEALRESEERFRNVYETAPLAFVIWNKNTRVTDWNKKAEEMFGWSKEEVVGHNIFDFLIPEKDRPQVEDIVNSLLQGDLLNHSINENLTKEGKIIICEWNNSVLHDDDGNIIGIISLGLDITDRKQAEEAVRESEERYRSFIENFHGIAYRGDIKAWKPIFFHGAVEQITGYSEEELIADNPNWYELIHPDDLSELKGKDEIASIPNYSTERQYRIKCKNGKFRWVSEFIKNIGDKYSVPKTVEGAIYDISELKEAEGALRASHEMFLTVLDSIDATIYVSDMETHEILFMNKNMKESFGRDMTGELCWKAFRRESKPCKQCTNDQLIDENGKPTGVYVWQGKNPITGRWYVNYDRAIKWIDGRFVRIQVATDTTEFKKAEKEKEQLEAQLQQAQKMEAMGTLAGGIAHDFNNLLMGIQGRTSLMLMDDSVSHPHKEHLYGIEDYVKRAADLTKQLLGFARGGKYEIKTTDVNELLSKQNKMFGRTRKEINIQEKFQENLWTIDADQGQIEQVLLNIYVNAWQAMPGGGDLIIQTEKIEVDKSYSKPYHVEPGRYVRISVTDTGEGMGEATRQKIFDPFFTTKEVGRGTGLGLASAYGIIKNHGGFIDVYSEIGKGTTFNIYLPASEKEAVEEEKLHEEVLKGTETVLLVDDEELIIDVGSRIIEKLGYEVLIARSGKAAIEIFRDNQDNIDIVILDMVMPGMSGGDTYDRLKEINPDIKALLSSGYSITGQATEILDRGCNGFIQKPFNLRSLSVKLREILDQD